MKTIIKTTNEEVAANETRKRSQRALHAITSKKQSEVNIATLDKHQLSIQQLSWNVESELAEVQQNIFKLTGVACSDCKPNHKVTKWMTTATTGERSVCVQLLMAGKILSNMFQGGQIPVHI